jgi:hypothetical protein
MALQRAGGGDVSLNPDQAANYAAMGGTAGMALGPLGGAVGAIGGGLYGLFAGGDGSGGYVDQYGNPIRAGTEGAFDPATWQQDWGNTDEAKRQALALYGQGDSANARSMGMLEQAALGNAPSAAQMQMQAGMDQALRNQLAAAASNRSANPAATFRQANQAGLSASLQNNQAMGALRAQEMATARSQFASSASANQQLMQQRAQYYMTMGFNQDQATNMAKQEAARLQSEITLGQMADATQREAAMMQAGASAVGTVTQAAPAIAGAMSDRRVKKKIDDADDDAKEMLKALAAYSYDYKNEKHGKGRQFGIMAQDLERSKMGKSLVFETPEGKAVRTDRAALAALAGLASIEKRLSKMEAA